MPCRINRSYIDNMIGMIHGNVNLSGQAGSIKRLIAGVEFGMV